MKPAIALDPDGDAADEFLMGHEESTAWLRIGGDDIVLRIYRPRKRAEQEDGTSHPELPLLGLEIFETPEQINEGVPSAVYAFGGDHGIPAMREEPKGPRSIRIEYLYRDAANNKRWGEEVFSNPESWSAEMVWQRLNAASQSVHLLPDLVHFRPEIVGVSTLYFTDVSYDEDEDEDEDDLELHELHRITECGAPVTDPRTIEEFIEEIRRTHGGE